MIAVAAAGSVGETIAPSANDIAHGNPITSCPITATAPAVARTSPIADNEITRASERRDRRSAKNAEAYSSGGRNTSSTSSGSSWMSGIPGTRPSARPPITSGIGYGTSSQLASAFSPAAATNSAAMTIWRSLTRRIVAGRRAGPSARGGGRGRSATTAT